MSQSQQRLPTRVTVRYCVADDQKRLLPRRPRAPNWLPTEAPTHKAGDVVYLAPLSVWAVHLVVYQWQAPDELCVEIWLEHVDTERQSRPSGFALTQ